MANFNYYNSDARKKYLNQNSSRMILLISSLIFSIAFLASIYLIFFMFNSMGEILLGLALALECFAITQKYSGYQSINKENLANRLTPDSIELIEKAIQKAKRDNIPEITSELLFDSYSETKFGTLVFMRLGIIFPREKKESFKYKNNPNFNLDLINLLEKIPYDITLSKILPALIAKSTAIQKYLSDLNITTSDVDKVLNWGNEMEAISNSPKIWENKNYLAGVGQDWSYGYTPLLSIFSTDLARFYNNLNIQIDIFSHQNKLSEIQTILTRGTKNNCLLVGDPGVGKKTIINSLALKISRGDCNARLKYKRIRELDLGRILTGATPNEISGRLEKCLAEAVSSGNIILYIDNIQILIGSFAHDEISGVNTAQILLPYLQNSKLQIIASVSEEDYFKKIRTMSSIAETFEKIDIKTASDEETLAILISEVNRVEYRNNVFFPVATLKKIVELSARHIHEVPMPEKAIRLLEEAASGLATGQIKMITSEDIEDLVSKKINIPLGEIQTKEKDKLLDLEKFIHERVVGQNEAVKAISDTLRRVRVGLTSGKRPAGVFLFLGPTGVGKTETAKALAQTYFGSEDKMIRLDMSEYQNPDSLDRLIGTTQSPSGILTDAILANPFSLILLDEIEKADKNILNLFLQVFEDGRLTSPNGKVSDFTNAIIISTSNAESDMISEKVKLHEFDNLKDELMEKLQKDNVFAPEFLNRYDGVIVFRPLTSEELTEVASLMIQDVNKTLENKKIIVQVDPSALAELVKMGYDPKFGARPMRRVIQEKVENLLAKKMLEGSAATGQTINITLDDIK